MTSKKVISFFIIAAAILAVSAVISVAIVLNRKKITPIESVAAYSFNFYETNDDSIRERGASKLTLSKSVAFKPTEGTVWGDNFATFKGENASDGVDYAITAYSSYVCLIPFSAKNGDDTMPDKHFRINFFKDMNNEDIITATSSALKNSLIVKVYCYETGTYYTEDEFNDASLEAKAGQTYNFCLVAISNQEESTGINYGTDKANINFLLSVI